WRQRKGRAGRSATPRKRGTRTCYGPCSARKRRTPNRAGTGRSASCRRPRQSPSGIVRELCPRWQIVGEYALVQPGELGAWFETKLLDHRLPASSVQGERFHTAAKAPQALHHQRAQPLTQGMGLQPRREFGGDGFVLAAREVGCGFRF